MVGRCLSWARAVLRPFTETMTSMGNQHIPHALFHPATDNCSLLEVEEYMEDAFVVVSDNGSPFTSPHGSESTFVDTEDDIVCHLESSPKCRLIFTIAVSRLCMLREALARSSRTCSTY